MFAVKNGSNLSDNIWQIYEMLGNEDDIWFSLSDVLNTIVFGALFQNQSRAAFRNMARSCQDWHMVAQGSSKEKNVPHKKGKSPTG